MCRISRRCGAETGITVSRRFEKHWISDDYDATILYAVPLGPMAKSLKNNRICLSRMPASVK